MTYHIFHLDRRLTQGPFYPEHQDYGQNQASHTEDALNFDMPPPIDPNLEQGLTAHLGTVSWPGVHTHQLKQYMVGPSTSLFALGQFQANYAYSQHDVNPLPPVSQGRHGSPFSQHHSSSCSDSLSPPTEIDVLPSTPPDMSATSPFSQAIKFQPSWDAQQSRLYTLRGIVPTQENPYVSLLEVNPSQDIFENEKAPEYDGSMALSFSSAGSQSEMEVQVKDEIFVAHSHSQPTYPDPDYEERDQSELEAEEMIMKHEDEDKEWTPHPSRKRTRSDANKAQYVATRPARKRSKVHALPRAVPSKSSHEAPHSTKHVLSCEACAQGPFRDEAALQKHMKGKHIRPFVCIFNFAGCSSSFPSKNEWKRHVVTQHLALSFWHCKQDACESCTNPASASQQGSPATDTPSPLPRGAIFNRKDLYTQHVRRMHVPPPIAKALRLRKPTPEWDDRLREMQTEAERRRCELPTHMQCPASGCDMVFSGANAWDERMEHVAKHLEKASEGREPMLSFGGDGDPTLTNWAASPGVGVVRKTDTGEWELMHPLRGQPASAGGIAKRGAKGHSSSSPQAARYEEESAEDVDADGEED
ncbi:hypothetical protein VD0002_g9742 [Verticillium dahliae]|uniref:C2H2-type domain-containing protein n=2 Tax=Verticillium dahliae TaxID=27337 RepID=G2XER1_VERDV|nr:uncharacterized protein VDAG_08646 [Verticillium dahliae VdLs.17]KAF3349019.1 Menaquinone biosynthesis methyltransferase ubiE [Verticillium dahliae VDG2]KAH6709709.1 hypothetical protein EV126DRAFT_1094 [Verticillium dahliae]EGY18312.1 hypothetical protein VDAG_08646 [Verticillium dahliae VdLs.17]PNH29525.1 hypothetical protein BJF96_g7280 [Verticillium dahliae]PNH37941.1 hypothetical protein VD0004_g8859 [Verticillium dahliae]